MIYLPAIFYHDKKAYLDGSETEIGSFCFGLLKNYEPKIEIILGKHNLTILSGINSLRMNQEIKTELPKAAEAVIATINALKRIAPFDMIDTAEIDQLFSEEKVSAVGQFLDDMSDPDRECEDSDSDEAIQNMLSAAELKQKMSRVLDFYSTMYDEVPQAFEKIRRTAERYSYCEKHDHTHLFALAYLEFWNETVASQQVVYTPLSLHGENGSTVYGKRIKFKSYTEFIITDLFEGISVGHYPRLCRVCGEPFFMTSAINQKYCGGMSLFRTAGGQSLSCRQYAKRIGEAEASGDDPYRSAFRKRCEVLRSEKNRGTITAEFAEMAKLTAQEYLTLALADLDYAEKSFSSDISREHLYAETANRLRIGGLTA